MPRATISHTHKKEELKSLEGGYVVLRKLTYDETLKRRDGAARLLMEANPGNANNGQPSKMELETMQSWSRKFEFRACIVEHNLEADDEGTLIDFKNDLAFTIIDPSIAEEIERLIDKLNGEDTEEALKDFTNAFSTLSAETPTEPLQHSDVT